MLSTSKLPLFFWAEAIATACYTQNRSIIIPTYEKTAYHIINDIKPSIRHLYIFGCNCYLTRDGENLDKMKEKGDPCILVGYSTQSKGYQVHNKRTRLIVESIHLRFNETKEMSKTSIDNNTSGLVLQRQKASNYDNSGPAPKLQNVSPLADTTTPLQQELDLLFDPLYDEFFTTGTSSVNKSSSPIDNSKQQDTPPTTDIQSTLEPLTPTNVNAEENNDNQEADTQFQHDEFINPFCTQVREVAESSSRKFDISNMHTFYQPHDSEYRWTKDHPLEQVHGNPSKPVQTRQQLAINPKMCMFALTMSIADPKNIKEAMADSAWMMTSNNVTFIASFIPLNLLQVKMEDPDITIEEHIRLEDEKARRRAIVFDDAFTSEATLSYEPTVSPPNDNKINFRIPFEESDNEDYMVIYDKNLFSYKIICDDDLKTDSENDNDKVNMSSFPSPKHTVSYFDDLDYFKDFKKEILAIVYNDALMSKLDFLTEPTVSPQHIDEFNLKDETSFSEYDEEEQNVICLNDLLSFNVIYPDELKMDTNNDNDKVDTEHSSEDLSVKPLHDLINTDVGAYAHGSNKLLETSNDTSNKFFKTETFVKGLNVNIMTWNNLNKGMSFIFLIKNLYVPFGIPFDPKLFYKDGSNLGQHIAYTSINTVYPGEWIQRIDFCTVLGPCEGKSMNVGGEFTKSRDPKVLTAVQHTILHINANWRISRASIRGVSHSNSF
ncbi:RNA-directed DNA polymerase, eukaryota [Tanacetum coccineum]